MKRIFALVFALFFIFSMTACGENGDGQVLPTEPEETEGPTVDHGELTLLFTGGLEGVYARDKVRGSVGYGALAAYAGEFEDVILIDGGNSVPGDAPEDLWEIVDACGYDLRVPGKAELSAGVDALAERAEDLKDCAYLSCNLLNYGDRTTVFEPYTLVRVGEITVGFVGVTHPRALTFRDLGIYTVAGVGDPQLLRDIVQQAVDDAAAAGADYVIVVGNLGTDPEDSPLTTVEVISGITGLAAWLDCGSGAVLDGDTVADKDDFGIPLCAPGAAFDYVGQVVLDLNDGTAAVVLMTELEDEDPAVQKLIDSLVAAE